MPRREYRFGIYMFLDKETGAVVYIGMDSHIDVHERRNAHLRPSSYNTQQINRVLQNNPDRYEYKVYCHADTVEEMRQLEFDLINLYRPKFNYRHGGQGRYLNPEFEYTVAKNGMSPKNHQQYVIKDKHRKQLITSIDREYLEEICQKLNDEELSPKEIRQWKRRTTNSFEANVKRSKCRNSSGFYRVRKRTDRTCKKGFLWTYEYYGENGKHKRFSRTDFFELKKEVERRKMIWQITDIDKAIKTIRSIHIGF